MLLEVLLLLLVAFASAAPFAEDADEQNILQMIQNAIPYENDILDNTDIALPKINEYEKESQEEVNKEIIPTTEFSVVSKSEIDTDYSQETVTESETESEIDLDSKPVAEVESVPEEQSNNTTKSDSIVDTEQQLEPNFDTEIVNGPNGSIDVKDTLSVEDFPPFILESPKYSIQFPEAVPELESTDLDETSIEDGLYSNQEWPQRYGADFPTVPETAQYEEAIFNMEDTPEIPINTFGNQAFPEEYIPEIYDSSVVSPMGPAYQIYNEQPSGQFIDIAPFVDAWSNTYPDPDTFNNNPEVNQFGGDGMAHAMIDDITIEPIYFDQVPKYYGDTPEILINGELPLEMLEEPDVMDNSSENFEDRIELIVIDEEMGDMHFTPIAEEVEQPQDSPIIPTAILQDTRPDIELLGLFDDSGDVVIIEEIEEKSYPLDEGDLVEEYPPVYEVSPDETFNQEDLIVDNSYLPVIEDESLLNPFDMMPPVISDFEQVTVPDMPILQELLFNKGNEQRIYFNNEVRENSQIFPQTFQSNPDFRNPHVHDQFSFGHANYQPHSHNENINYHGDIPHTHYHGDTPHTHNEHQFNFDNAPHNHYFDDVSGSMKRDGAHIVPDMDNMEMPMMEMGEMEIFNSPMGEMELFNSPMGENEVFNSLMGEMEVFNSPMIDPSNPRATPQITVILVSKPQEVKRIWSQLIRPMQQKPFSPVDMSQSQGNLHDFNEVSQTQHRFENEITGHGHHQFGNMGQFPQNPNTNQFNQNFYGQNFNEQPMQNYNAYQNMNLPPNQLFNSGMSPFTPNFNQQPNMGAMFPNLDFDLTLEDLEQIASEDMERENMFASQQPSSPYGPQQQPGSPYGPQQQPSSPYGPQMFSFSNNQQTWPNRYAPNYQEMNFGNNGQFYPQQNMNSPFFIPSK